MAYNKAREEKKWRLWKQAEEKELRKLGVGEDTIQKLREHDWEIFNSERRYYEKLQETGTYLDAVAEGGLESEIRTVINCQVKVLTSDHIIKDTLFTMLDMIFNAIGFTCYGYNCSMVENTIKDCIRYYRIIEN